MTVAELRAILAKHPDTMRVIAEGYEGGLVDVQAVTIPINLNVNDDPGLFGPHILHDPKEFNRPDEIAILITDADPENVRAPVDWPRQAKS